jgi:hypothetical protein
MDEIIIDDKKYISSKQAAKITGYAKDYIGQLCREGRVPARLVGRSWYVLEGAIQDHRFGTDIQYNPDSIKAEKPSIQSTWEAPRYESSASEELPSMLNRSEKSVEDAIEKDDSEESGKDLQDSWQAWFSRMSEIDANEAVKEVENITAIEPEEIQEEEVENREEKVEINIKHVYEPQNRPISEGIHIIRSNYKDPPKVAVKKSHSAKEGNKVLSAIRMGSLLVAVLAIAISIIGTGYFDSYIQSGNPAGLLAGVSFYHK